jgi:hypothetical protein
VAATGLDWGANVSSLGVGVAVMRFSPFVGAGVTGGLVIGAGEGADVGGKEQSGVGADVAVSRRS